MGGRIRDNSQWKGDHILKQKLDELIEVFNMGYSMVLLYDSEGNLINWNQQADNLFPECESESGYNLTELLPHVFYVYAGGICMESSFISGKSRTLLYPQGAECIPVELKVYHKVIEEKKIGICVMRDLTEMRESKIEKTEFMNEVMELIQERMKLLAQITHDLKTPLHGISTMVYAMKGNAETAEDQENFRLMEECCTHMEKIIDQVLVHEQLKHGGNLLREEYIDMYRLIENSVAVNRFMAEEKGLEVYCNISGRIPKIIYGDRGKIGEILVNLLTNAIKFTQIGFISLNVLCSRIGPNRMQLLFMVSDTGEGIDEKQHEKIFEAYHRNSAKDNVIQKGTGLGLAIVKRLVTAMNGEIRVVSSPGKGSKFYCTVEVKRDADDAFAAARKLQIQEAKLCMDELMEELDRDVIPETEKKKREYILKVKEFGTVENEIAIVRSLNLLDDFVERERWKAANEEVKKLHLLIPASCEKLWNQSFQLELSIRRNDQKGAMLHLEKLEEYFLPQ